MRTGACTTRHLPAALRPELARFSTISLRDLERRAALLDREERKYLVTVRDLRTALRSAKGFLILKHRNRTSFRYESIYFDAGFTTYRDHHQGRRLRCKVRSRRYVDSGLCFLEIKLKGKRGRTDKRRIARSLEEHGQIGPDAQAFVREAYRKKYGKPLRGKLTPTLAVTNTRITLVSAKDQERVTIDTQVRFSHHGRETALAADIVIIETKTPRGHGRFDTILRRLSVRPVRLCSKYCLGIAMLGLVRKRNRFLPTLRQLNRTDETDDA